MSLNSHTYYHIQNHIFRMPEASWALLMEANSEVTEATKRIVEFCQWRCRDPRAWTNAHRSRLLRLIERQEETQKALSALILELLRKEEIFGDGPCPNMREGHLLGWHLCSRDATMRVKITVGGQDNPNSKITPGPDNIVAD